ncbi:MAG: hypothetical protein V4732_20180 [Pseudomonadota bacterium]
MKTNPIIFSAGLLAAFTAAVHTFAGTYEIHGPLLGSSLPESVSLLLYACWHLVTVTLILSAVALIWSARNSRAKSNSALPVFIGLLWLCFGIVFIVVAVFFSGVDALIVLPQWILLMPIGGLVLLGVRKQVR